jgi:ribosomal protein S4
MVWHQLVATYGKKIKNLVYTKHKSKKIFNSKFGEVLCKLELRLNILVLRVGFVNTLRLADLSVYNGSLMINFKIKHKRYLVRINDLISFSILFLKVQDLKRLKKKI